MNPSFWSCAGRAAHRALFALLALSLISASLPGNAQAETEKKAEKKSRAEKQKPKKKPAKDSAAQSSETTATAASLTTPPADAATTSTGQPTAAATPNIPASSPASLWISATTSATLATINDPAWNAMKFPFEVVIYKIDPVELETPYGKQTGYAPNDASERPIKSEQAARLVELLTNPKTYSRELTPEDACTHAPRIGIRFRGDSGIMRITLTPECNEVTLAGSNSGDEPVGNLRLGYGPRRVELLEALREPAKDFLPDTLLR